LCHANGYANTPNTCYGCHATNYNQTTNPNHVTSQFTTTCEICHSTSAWTPATFNHNTVYPLIGSHATIANNCISCHANGYTNTPNTCYGCHATNYTQTTNPNHITAQFATTCEVCHTPSGWVPSSFNHATVFPLIGAHATIANNCNACHANGYANTPNTCIGCHQTDYNQANDPNHASAQFPTTCLDCHTQTAWSPSTFNHDGQYFPIYSGKHKNKWDACSDCHPNASNYSIFTCTTSCHSQSSTNNDHQGVSGYSYNSNACLNCHPNGSGDKSMIQFKKNN
jgi:hypothetical protein